MIPLDNLRDYDAGMASILIGSQAGPAATLDQPLEHLLACHRRIEQRLETLERVVPYLWDRREEALAAIRNVLAFVDTSGALHTADEEVSVFPRLAGRLNPRQEELLRTLEGQHRSGESIYAGLKSVVDNIARQDAVDEDLRDEYREAVAYLCDLYRSHIQLEETQLLSVCRSLLTSGDLAAIAAEMRARRGVKPAAG